MKNKKLFYLAAALIVCAAVVFVVITKGLKKEGAEQKSVTFKLEKTFGAESQPKEALLSGVYSMEMDDQKNLYFIDKRARVVSIAPDGSVRWVIDKKGKGPGDIQNPRGLATDGIKYLYLSNIKETRIDKFDLDGKFVSSFAVSDMHQRELSILGFVKPNLLVTAISFLGKIGYDVFILEADNNFKIRNQFVIDKSGSLKLSPGVGLSFDIGIMEDKIVTGSITNYELGFYTLEGKEVKTIKKDVRNLFLAYVFENGVGMVGNIGYPFKISGSYYLNAMTVPSNVTDVKQLMQKDFKIEDATTIEVFNENGESVYSVKTSGTVNPEIGRPIYSDSEGYLYTFKELPYPQICKYKVIIEDKK